MTSENEIVLVVRFTATSMVDRMMRALELEQAALSEAGAEVVAVGMGELEVDADGGARFRANSVFDGSFADNRKMLTDVKSQQTLELMKLGYSEQPHRLTEPDQELVAAAAEVVPRILEYDPAGRMRPSRHRFEGQLCYALSESGFDLRKLPENTATRRKQLYKAVALALDVQSVTLDVGGNVYLLLRWKEA